MDKPVLLWTDPEPPVRESAFSESIGAHCIVHRIVGTSVIDAKIALIRPDVIYFDYDYRKLPIWPRCPRSSGPGLALP